MAETRGGRPIAASQRPTGGDKAIATGKKQYFRRKKVCRFCVEKVDDINYKDIKMLGNFVSERGKITPRRISGVCTPHQKRLSEAIKQARNIALLPAEPGAPIPGAPVPGAPAPLAAPAPAPVEAEQK